jgi:hypothetical protein
VQKGSRKVLLQPSNSRASTSKNYTPYMGCWAIPRVTCVTLRDLLRPVLQVRRRYPKTFSAPLCSKTSLTMMTTKVFMVTSTFSEICQQSERHVRFTEFCHFWNSEFMCKILWFGKLMIQFLFIMDTRDYFQLNAKKIVCKNWNLKIWQRFKNVWSVSRALRNVRYTFGAPHKTCILGLWMDTM